MKLEGCLEALQGLVDLDFAGIVNLFVDVLLGFDIDG